MRRHNKDRKFRCENCGSEFYRSTQLKNHMKNRLRCFKSKVNKEYERKFFKHRKDESTTEALSKSASMPITYKGSTKVVIPTLPPMILGKRNF